MFVPKFISSVMDGPVVKKLCIEEEYGVDEMEQEWLMKIMGIKCFDTTKNKDHSRSDCFAVLRVQGRKTRRVLKPKSC